MTNYLTAAGVQQVSITIASGSLTGTATITAVGSGAFIIWQGQTATETANYDDGSARIELTNSTTVTATRGVTGTSKTMVVNAVVVDGDTTNLVKSVQSGTINIAASTTSNTASISAVTNNNTAIVYLGQSIAVSDTIVTTILTRVDLSGTTVTATVGAPIAGGAITVGYCVIEFQGSALNSSVQNIAYNATFGTTNSDTSTISSVTTANTWLAYGGQTFTSATQIRQDLAIFQLTAATTITYTWNSTNLSQRAFNSCVVEFVSGVLAQTIQRGTISLAAATSNTATITSAATANSFCNWLGNSSNNIGANPAITEYRITQTNATTLTMNVNSSATGTGSYEVITFATTASPTTAGFNQYYSGFIGRIDGEGGSV